MEQLARRPPEEALRMTMRDKAAEFDRLYEQNEYGRAHYLYETARTLGVWGKENGYFTESDMIRTFGNDGYRGKDEEPQIGLFSTKRVIRCGDMIRKARYEEDKERLARIAGMEGV